MAGYNLNQYVYDTLFGLDTQFLIIIPIKNPKIRKITLIDKSNKDFISLTILHNLSTVDWQDGIPRMYNSFACRNIFNSIIVICCHSMNTNNNSYAICWINKVRVMLWDINNISYLKQLAYSLKVSLNVSISK